MIRKILLVIGMTLFLTNVAMADSNFSDTNNEQWFYNDLDYVTNDSRQILSGYPDGSFKPNDHLTVEEFVKCVIVAAELNVVKEDGDRWSTPYLVKALEKGYILAAEFDQYNRPITRGEMAQIIARSVEDITGDYYFRNRIIFKDLVKDYDEFHRDLRPNIIKTYDIGIIGGYPDGKFKPNNLLTRAEAITVVRRLIDVSSRLKPDVFDPEVKTESALLINDRIDSTDNSMLDISIVVDMRYDINYQLTELETYLMTRLDSNDVSKIIAYLKKKKYREDDLPYKTIKWGDNGYIEYGSDAYNILMYVRGDKNE